LERKWGNGKIMISVAAPCPKCRKQDFIAWLKDRNIENEKSPPNVDG
jgi:hypothetical protein